MHDTGNLFLLGSLASLVAGLGTSLGALGVLVVRGMADRMKDALLSAAAGIMLAASFFSLLLPGIEAAQRHLASRSAAVGVVIAGVLMGAVALFGVHRCVPHEHFVMGREGPESHVLKRIWLLVIAMTIHNFPEGMAVGVGFAAGGPANGTAIATGIGLQNIPEGLAVAVSLLGIGYSRAYAFAVATLTGLVEPVGGVIGSAAAWLAEPVMPWTLGFAAGAMLFVISGEIIPETHRRGYQALATFSLLGGFVVMMFLDATLA